MKTKYRKQTNKERMEERAIMIAEYLVETKDTLRGAALKFNVSKSTVHKDLSQRIYFIDNDLAIRVREIIEINKKERNIRGGLATKAKYEKK